MKRGFSYFLVFRKKERGKKKKKSSKVRDRQRNHLNEKYMYYPSTLRKQAFQVSRTREERWFRGGGRSVSRVLHRYRRDLFPISVSLHRHGFPRPRKLKETEEEKGWRGEEGRHRRKWDDGRPCSGGAGRRKVGRLV